MATSSMRRTARRPLLGCLFALAPLLAAAGETKFVRDLETCIRNHAEELAATFPQWGNKCMAVTEKVDFQAALYDKTLTPMYEAHGYTGALWCAVYSLGMVPIVDVTQPNNPNFDVWYHQLLCPWNFPRQCGRSDDELTEREHEGVLVCDADHPNDPSKCAPNQHPQYAIYPKCPRPGMPTCFQNDDPHRRTMSCALCGRLHRTFAAGAPVGAPDLIKANIGVEYSLEGVPEAERPLYTAWWDAHAFGAWLANTASRKGWPEESDLYSRTKINKHIGLYKATNGEEIHGFLWQSLRLLAQDDGTLEGKRIKHPPHGAATELAHKTCEQTWWVSPQSMNDCAHAAGHGYFYYFLDVGRAVLACMDPSLHEHAPDPKYSWDRDPKMGGLDGLNLLMWRWLCATGVYHAAANTLSLAILDRINHIPQNTVIEFLCKRQNVWGDDKRWFDRCAAGLGITDAEHRLHQVKTGECVVPYGSEPAAWEEHQFDQYGQTLQLACNPASKTTGFTAAMGTCPEAFRMHFPCRSIVGDWDHRICTGEWFGTEILKTCGPHDGDNCVSQKPGEGEIRPYHRLCMGHDVLRKIFECPEPIPRRPGENQVLYAQEWPQNKGPKPWNVINFYYGLRVGVWGGKCTCPDGRVYMVGDRGNACGSTACEGGISGECPGGENEGAFRKVICETDAYKMRPGQTHKSGSRNEIINNAPGVGTWGGECTCPDGAVYLVGDEGNQCGSMACEGGKTGPCNHYVSGWAHRRVRCDVGKAYPNPPPPPPLPPSPPPSPPPLPPPPTPPPPPPPSPPAPSPPPPRPPAPPSPPPPPSPPSPPPNEVQAAVLRSLPEAVRARVVAALARKHKYTAPTNEEVRFVASIELKAAEKAEVTSYRTLGLGRRDLSPLALPSPAKRSLANLPPVPTGDVAQRVGPAHHGHPSPHRGLAGRAARPLAPAQPRGRRGEARRALSRWRVIALHARHELCCGAGALVQAGRAGHRIRAS